MELVTRDTDGQYYLDYLKAGPENMNEPEYFLDFPEKRQAIIRKGLQHPDGDVRKKHRLLRRKHNDRVRALRDSSVEANGFTKAALLLAPPRKGPLG